MIDRSTSKSWNNELVDVEEHIEYLLQHPGLSEWLKSALRHSLKLNPGTVLNDLSMLNLVLTRRSEALLMIAIKKQLDREKLNSDKLRIQ